MTRSLSGANSTNYAGASVREIVFVYLDFTSGILRLHNSVGNYAWGGNTWSGVGQLGSVSILEEGVEVRPMRIKLTLSGLDSGIVGTAMDEEYHGRDVKIYRGTCDSDNVLASDPDIIWSGFMDYMTVSLSQGTGVVELVCENILARYDTARVQRMGDADQQKRFAGDLFFEYLPQLSEYSVEWGGEAVNPRYNVGGNVGGPGIGPDLPRRVP